MARRVGVGNVRPRDEREDSITQRQRLVWVPITDLNAEARRRRALKVKRWVLRGALVIGAVLLALALVWACGKGARR